jgi:hypothetical protein
MLLTILRRFAIFPALLPMGCGGKYLPPYVHVATPAAAVIENQGLRLTVEPLLSVQSCQTYFGMDCLQKGILPVFIAATNAHSAFSYRIVTHDIWFGAGPNYGVVVKAGVEGSNNVAAGSSQAIAGGVIAGLSPILGIAIVGAGMKATDDAESIRENFVIKQFQNVTLSPGRHAEGFVYFVQTNQVHPDQLPSINIPVRDQQSQGTNVLSSLLGKNR